MENKVNGKMAVQSLMPAAIGGGEHPMRDGFGIGEMWERKTRFLSDFIFILPFFLILKFEIWCF